MRCRDCGFDPCACGNENYEELMKSLTVQLEKDKLFFSKEARDHKLEVARQTGLPSHEIKIRFLSVDVQANEAMIFYEVVGGGVEK